MRLFAGLAQRPFALLWAGRSISALGDGIYLMALAWWVLETTGSAAANGIILICATLPTLLLLLLGGVVVDRLPRRTLLLLSDVLRGLLVSVIAVLAGHHLLAFWHLALLSAAFGIVQAFFGPAYTSIIPEITPREALASANALASLSRQATGILGPALGGLLVALGGTPAAFALDGLSFLLSAACIIAMPALPVVAPKRGTTAHLASASVLGEVRDGLRTVLWAPWLWITIAIAGISNVTLSGPLEAVLPLLVRERLGGSVGAYAALNALDAVGAVMAAVALGQVVRLRHRGPLTYGAWLVAAAALLLMGLPVGLAGVGVAMALCGAALATLNLTWAHTLQELVPPDRLGRVASIDALGSYALLPVAYGLAGAGADRFGAPAVFVAGGAASLVVIGLGLLHPAVRDLD
ncbi:MAG: MFS transporter [Ktedonobacterales bacterium]